MKKLPDSALPLKPKDCVMADGLVETLFPLPAGNLARLMGIINRAYGKGIDACGKHDFQVCA